MRTGLLSTWEVTPGLFFSDIFWVENLAAGALLKNALVFFGVLSAASAVFFFPASFGG